LSDNVHIALNTFEILPSREELEVIYLPRSLTPEQEKMVKSLSIPKAWLHNDYAGLSAGIYLFTIDQELDIPFNHERKVISSRSYVIKYALSKLLDKKVSLHPEFIKVPSQIDTHRFYLKEPLHVSRKGVYKFYEAIEFRIEFFADKLFLLLHRGIHIESQKSFDEILSMFPSSDYSKLKMKPIMALINNRWRRGLLIDLKISDGLALIKVRDETLEKPLSEVKLLNAPIWYRDILNLLGESLQELQQIKQELTFISVKGERRKDSPKLYLSRLIWLVKRLKSLKIFPLKLGEIYYDVEDSPFTLSMEG